MSQPLAVPSPPADLDLAAVSQYLDETLPGFRAGRLRGHLIAGGRSNLTYLVADGAREWVLRRPPLGHLLETAHDVAREHRVLTALNGTDLPVPVTILLAPASVIGAPFFLMEYVDGTVYRTREQLLSLGAREAEQVADVLIDVLAQLHELDAVERGLGDLGRPAGYLQRQLIRWGKQLEASRSRDLPGLGELATRLAAAVPETRRNALVHGDYRLDNVVLTNGGPFAVMAVLDWELSTLGDPLTDLASAVVWWDGVAGLDSPVAAVPGDLSHFPSSQRMVDRYALLTGADISLLPWYIAFAYYKIAAIFEGIHFRYQQGLTVGGGFERLGALVPTIADRGRHALSEVTT